jgi:hypothetical protein
LWCFDRLIGGGNQADQEDAARQDPEQAAGLEKIITTLMICRRKTR